MKVSTGKGIRKMCSVCNTPQPQAGSAVRYHGLYKAWICKLCKEKEKAHGRRPLG